MAGFGGLLGPGSAAQQFLIYGVAYEVARVLLTPYTDTLLQDEYARNPVSVLSPAELADMVVRNILTEDAAAAEAARSGVNAERFHRQVLDTGEPVGLELALEMYRRGIIPLGEGTPGEASVKAAIRTGRVRNEWTDAIIASREVPLPPAVAVDAVVEGQVDRDTAERKAYASGVSAEDFAIMVNTRGNPPSPTQLLEMFRRGIIPMEGTGPQVTSVQQGIFEGATKDKWWTKLAALAHIVPPPRTITALEREGVISPAEAQHLYQQAGLSPELAAVYSASASAGRTTAHKQLAETQVLQLYDARIIPQGEARKFLTDLGYPPAEADLILELHAHVASTTQLSQATRRVQNLYIGHHIDRAGALRALHALGVADAESASLVQTWDLEVSVNVRALTPAQVAEALDYGIMDQAAAMAQLERLGYTPYDAWVVLSIKAKGPLPGMPARGPGPSPALT